MGRLGLLPLFADQATMNNLPHSAVPPASSALHPSMPSPPTTSSRTPSTPATHPTRVQAVADGSTWNRFVETHANDSIAHRFEWKSIIESSYHHRTFYLGAFEGEQLTGVLPLVLTKSRWFGNHLTSVPFLDYGGSLARTPATQQTLFQSAQDLADEHQAQLCLRFDHDPGLDVVTSLRRVTLKLPLVPGDTNATWKQVSSSRRSQIRKAQRYGLTATMHGSEALDDFYRVYARNMRDLGSPVHALGFIRAAVEQLADRSRIAIVRDGDQPVGAAIGFRSGQEFWVPWVSSIREAFFKCPNQLLYWSLMEWATNEQLHALDLGRSNIGDGTYKAKRQWGAEVQQLHWVYAPTETQASQSGYGRVTKLWQRLPMPVANRLGPHLRRQIPG